MQWYKIRFTKEEIASGESELLTDHFIKVFTDMGSPKGMALFSEGDTLEDEYTTYYLNSIAFGHSREITKIYSATPCSVPSGKNLQLVFGDSDLLVLN